MVGWHLGYVLNSNDGPPQWVRFSEGLGVLVDRRKEDGMPNDRSESNRAYYEANKAKKKAKRKPQPRTEATLAAAARCAEKRRVLAEIAAMTFGPPVDA